MKITPDLFAAFSKCPTKCWLLVAGEPRSGNAYAEWVKLQNTSYRVTATERFLSETSVDKSALSPSAENLKADKWYLAASLVVQAQMNPYVLASSIHAVERVPSEGQGKPTQFIPIHFVFTNKLGKNEKLLLALDAFILSETLGYEISHGKIIHGDGHAILKVKTSAITDKVWKRVENIAALLSSPSLPDLVLNRHCTECEFQTRCRQMAIEKDDLSLLASMSEKERKKLHSKGIFTVTQLSYTFRPRRRPKQLRDKREKYHHSLKALAIREKKIYIVGSPELKIEGTPVYLDVEGLPDRDFYYLIGVRIGNGESAVQHSLWADAVEDERKIWREFLDILETVERPVLIHYGSYETTFFKRMSESYESPPEGSVAVKSITSAINMLSVTFAHIYFPTYSNGLKEIADWLGFKWSGLNPSGTQSIVWRREWDKLGVAHLKQRLLIYNSEDCAGLELIANTVLRVCNYLVKPDSISSPFPNVSHADSLPSRETMFPKFSSPIEALEAINKAASWDYQRDRIYIRTDKQLKRNEMRRNSKVVPTGHINREYVFERPRICPYCGRTGESAYKATRILYDLRFSRFGVRRWAVRYRFHYSYCHSCHRCFGKPKEFWEGTHYGRNVVALLVFKVIELCESQRAAAQDMNTMFRLGISDRQVYHLKVSAAKIFEETRQSILLHMVKGPMIHADETRINLHGKSGYVWVFATFCEVAYFYAESREGDILQKLLSGFNGVLVSDFYAAYDSFPCPQQKCLIHLVRDLNDTLLDHAYDEEVKGIVTSFAELLKIIVQTIDRRGLKRHFLRKHIVEVERFYRKLSRTTYMSETALKCKERFEKNRNKLFTFLE
jgi:predicted RecB family nuclease